MHRLIRDHLEQVLAERVDGDAEIPQRGHEEAETVSEGERGEEDA